MRVYAKRMDVDELLGPDVPPFLWPLRTSAFQHFSSGKARWSASVLAS